MGRRRLRPTLTPHQNARRVSPFPLPDLKTPREWLCSQAVETSVGYPPREPVGVFSPSTPELLLPLEPPGGAAGDLPRIKIPWWLALCTC